MPVPAQREDAAESCGRRLSIAACAMKARESSRASREDLVADGPTVHACARQRDDAVAEMTACARRTRWRGCGRRRAVARAAQDGVDGSWALPAVARSCWHELRVGASKPTRSDDAPSPPRSLSRIPRTHEPLRPWHHTTRASRTRRLLRASSSRFVSLEGASSSRLISMRPLRPPSPSDRVAQRAVGPRWTPRRAQTAPPAALEGEVAMAASWCPGLLLRTASATTAQGRACPAEHSS